MTPFHDLQDYQALPRLGGLRLAPDGSWLAATVSALAPDGRTFKPSIWRVDTAAGRPAVRLTRSAEGEDSPAFLPDGSLVFLSARPAPPGTRPASPASPPEARAPGPPMLVIHGDKDYRVPVGEALRLWTDLASRPGHLAGSKFLYYPDENHWVLGPGNSRIWYETVFAFLAQHVLGEPWQRPGLL